jgi:hypothetical protein
MSRASRTRPTSVGPFGECSGSPRTRCGLCRSPTRRGSRGYARARRGSRALTADLLAGVRFECSRCCNPGCCDQAYSRGARPVTRENDLAMLSALPNPHAAATSLRPASDSDSIRPAASARRPSTNRAGVTRFSSRNTRAKCRGLIRVAAASFSRFSSSARCSRIHSCRRSKRPVQVACASIRSRPRSGGC